MARIGSFLSRLVCIDALLSVETGNPQLNEERQRARVILLVYGAWACFWALACLATPGASLDGPVRPDYVLWWLLRAVSHGMFGLGALAAATALWMHADYLACRHRSKMRRAARAANHPQRA